MPESHLRVGPYAENRYQQEWRKVADEASKRRPLLKILFTTGYTRNAIIHHGRLDDDVELLLKPFTAADVVGKVYGILHGGNAAL